MTDEQAPPPRRAKRVRPPSRQRRWEEAVAKLTAAKEKAEEAQGEAGEALSELNELKSEYEDWQGNLPENLQNSPLGEKLQAVADLDIPEEWDSSTSLDDVEQLIGELEGVELPLGFGRD